MEDYLDFARHINREGYTEFTFRVPTQGVRVDVFPYLDSEPIKEYMVFVPTVSFGLKFVFNYTDDDFGDLWKVYSVPYRMAFQPASGYDFSKEELMVDDETDLLNDEVV